MRISLTSTSEVYPDPPPARIWRGRTDDGVEVVAFVSIAVPSLSSVAELSPEVLERTRRALEERIPSAAIVTIPDGTPAPERPVRREWESYRREVLPRAAGDVQVLETRRAFYAGAWALLNLLEGLGSVLPGEEATDDDVDLVDGMLEKITAELSAFGAAGGQEKPTGVARGPERRSEGR